MPFEGFCGAIDQPSFDAVALRSWFFTHGLAALMTGRVEEME